MLKKLIISSFDDINNPYYGGGGAVAVHEIAKRLASEYAVVIVTGKYPHARNCIVDGVYYKRIGLSLLGPKVGQILFAILLPFLAMLETYDVWIESFTPPFSTANLQLFSSKPVVGLVHMLSAKDMQRKYKIPLNVLKTIENAGLRSYKHFIVVTRESKREIQEINKRASFLVAPNGIYPPIESNPYYKRAQKYMLFVGRIEINQKGLDLLMEAVSKVQNSIDMKLVIAGTGAQKEIDSLKHLIKTLGVESVVEMVGKVRGAEKESLYANAAFCILPSRFETFSMVALETLARRIPLVTFDIAGLNWMPKEAVITVPCFQTKILSSAIFTLATSKEKRDAISRNIPNLGDEFNWDNIALKYSDYLAAIT